MVKKVKKSGAGPRKAKRRYDSSRRQAQAAETRVAIMNAARELFRSRGYMGATIEGIAKAAGVAQETVYGAFGSKRELLSVLVMRAVLGDPPVPFLERTEVLAVLRERDQRKQIRLYPRTMTVVHQGVGELWQVMRGAELSDPEIATLIRDGMRGRMGGVNQFISALLGNGPLRPGITPTIAAETVWALASPEVYHMLCIDRGWTIEHYEEWLSESLERLLLP